MFKKGFTLIELLVVIAIIAILAAILFPVFAQAREKARQTSCLSNCKQLGTGIQLYCDDYDETYPPLGDLTGSTIGWTDWNDGTYKDYPGKHSRTTNSLWWGSDFRYSWCDCIFPYVKNLNMYECPSDKRHFKASVYNAGYASTDCFVIGYAMNAALNSSAAGKGDGANQSNNGNIYVHSLSEMPNVSNTIFCADAPTIWYSGGQAGSAFVCRYTMKAFKGMTEKSTGNRHNDGANFTMLDGHAKFFKDGQGALNYTVPDSDHYNDTGYEYWDPWYNN